jgi:hypothetical protein
LNEYHLYKHLRSRDGIALAASADPLEAFRPGVEAMLNVLATVTGSASGVWLNASAGPETGDWFARFQAAVAPASEGSREITDAEENGLLAGVQPPGAPGRGVAGPGTLEPDAGLLQPEHQDLAATCLQARARTSLTPLVLRTRLVTAAEEAQKAQDAGFNDPIAAIVETVRTQNEAGEGGGVCARVKLRLEQEAVITRDAFRATLEIDNQDAADLENIEVTVQAYDAEGRLANDISAPSAGAQRPERGGRDGVVRSGSTGTARWLIVLTVDAAPEEPLQYFIAGTFVMTSAGRG